jgi:hypothetical protein
MPLLPQVAAFIIDGEVVNVGVLSTDHDYEACHALLAGQFDEILIVQHAAIGWKVTPDGLRPDKPFPSWVWNDVDGWYEAPIPWPSDGGQYEWDESAQSWNPAP